MCDRKHRRIRELSKRLLDESIGELIDAGSSLIENHDFGPAKNRTSKAEQLALPCREVLAVRRNSHLEPIP
jgi:hypothetical protein